LVYGRVVAYHCGSVGARYGRLCFVVEILVDGVIKSNTGKSMFIAPQGVGLQSVELNGLKVPSSTLWEIGIFQRDVVGVLSLL
jgi:hypothetical protein